MTEIIYKKSNGRNREKAGNRQGVDLITNEAPETFEEEIQDINLSVKQCMAAELKNMGLSEDAISRQLNLKRR